MKSKKNGGELKHPPQYRIWEPKSCKISYCNGFFSAGIVLKPDYLADVIYLNIRGDRFEMTVDEAAAISSILCGAIWEYQLEHFRDEKRMVKDGKFLERVKS